MKKILIASAALAAVTATSAYAATTDTQTAEFTVQAANPAKCSLSATSGSIVLGNDQLTTDQGFASPGLTQAVVDQLNADGVKAWCTGNNNKFNITRTAFTTDNGGTTTEGFMKGILYDIGVQNPSSNGQGNENTEDGPGLGLTFGRFGPTTDSALTFAAYANTIPVATSAAANANGATGSFTTSATTRVIAGQYTSTITLTITPGV